ncbi:MAG: hypothetical protein NTU81_03335 [Candidatus Nomurabacteria bacterium]|nr:hypothetical protein [Candidatus Nomurabacteria bacterium]
MRKGLGFLVVVVFLCVFRLSAQEKKVENGLTLGLRYNTGFVFEKHEGLIYENKLSPSLNFKNNQYTYRLMYEILNKSIQSEVDYELKNGFGLFLSGEKSIEFDEKYLGIGFDKTFTVLKASQISLYIELGTNFDEKILPSFGLILHPQWKILSIK